MHLPLNSLPSQGLLASGAVNVDLDPTFIAHFVLFTAFVVLMKDLIFDPLMRVFEERERRTAGAISRARELDEQAIQLKQEFDDRLDEVRRDAAVDRERIREEVKQLEAELSEEARAAVKTKLEAGLAAIGEDVKQIQSDLESDRSALAAQIASKVLGREVSAQERGAR